MFSHVKIQTSSSKPGNTRTSVCKIRRVIERRKTFEFPHFSLIGSQPWTTFMHLDWKCYPRTCHISSIHSLCQIFNIQNNYNKTQRKMFTATNLYSTRKSYLSFSSRSSSSHTELQKELPKFRNKSKTVGSQTLTSNMRDLTCSW